MSICTHRGHEYQQRHDSNAPDGLIELVCLHCDDYKLTSPGAINNLAAEEMRDCETCGTPCYTKTCFRCAIHEKNAAEQKANLPVCPSSEMIFDMACKLEDYQSRDIWYDSMNSEDPADRSLVRQANNAQRAMRHAANMLRELAGPTANVEPPRIVIALRKGVVTAVYLSDGPVAHSEVLIADEDAFDTWSQGDSFPAAVVMPSLPLEALNDVREIANMVLAFEGEDVSCAQCGDEFKPDDVVDGEFCKASCSDRHFRM